ncbi:dihydrolipoyl dehydrogenase [Saccharospirillum sp. MSK14-1]|uniref:dihydrolipoyl dehydrogenase n=1 Tax=Saccharospirillum sp. MSK14-1 TaxID=1897632 RepID=UPI000D3690C0|nr:dihydrolipoyl dehydrogenase [Saccharospirillum sp. MSK14-1]PTY37356.1 dihydrolipoyl dehydrogenase [Saccharospirillum sp. MSK14-1]
MTRTTQAQLVVLGGGPGGYSAAFRAADLGMNVTLIERYARLGGVCLNVGCIPSKALLHIAGVIEENEHLSELGFSAQQPELKAVQQYRDQTVERMTTNLSAMAKERGVTVIQANAVFEDSQHLRLTQADGDESLLGFEQLILATGSRVVELPFLPNDERIWDSTDALQLSTIPPRLLVIGGGIIGLEMATVYRALGSTVSIVEAANQLIPAADADLVRLYQRDNNDRFDIRLNTRLDSVTAGQSALNVTLMDAQDNAENADFDAILVAVGRRPNGDLLQAEKAGVNVDDRGFIGVDEQLRTNVSHIFAIGDLVGQPMLAHKASHQGHVAAEVAAGESARFTPMAIPSIAYTHPEVAWTGLTEKDAKAQGLNIRTAAFPWSASGRALASGQNTGRTKLIFDADTDRLLGAGLVGAHAGELLGELTLALEFGASTEDLALTIHGHPTLHETVGLAAEMASGTITDLPNPRAKKPAPA